MEAEARYAWVGVAVIALVGLIAGGLWWLTGGAEDREIKRYTVYFEHQSLEGLQINSDVRMQGIKVGKVQDYAIIPGQARKVRVLLQVDARTPVFEGATAVVARHLVTGLAAIDVENGPQGGVPLMRSAEGEQYPVIPEGVPQFARVASTLEDLGVSGREAIERFNTLLSDRNQAAIAGTLGNVERLTGELNQAMPAVRDAIGSLDKAASNLEAAGVETAKTLNAAGERVSRAADTTKATMDRANAVLEGMDKEMRGLSLGLKLTADLAAQEIQATAQSLRVAGDTLQETGRALADPARVIYGPVSGNLGPGEGK